MRYHAYWCSPSLYRHWRCLHCCLNRAKNWRVLRARVAFYVHNINRKDRSTCKVCGVRTNCVHKCYIRHRARDVIDTTPVYAHANTIDIAIVVVCRSLVHIIYATYAPACAIVIVATTSTTLTAHAAVNCQLLFTTDSRRALPINIKQHAYSFVEYNACMAATTTTTTVSIARAFKFGATRSHRIALMLQQTGTVS